MSTVIKKINLFFIIFFACSPMHIACTTFCTPKNIDFFYSHYNKAIFASGTIITSALLLILYINRLSFLRKKSTNDNQKNIKNDSPNGKAIDKAGMDEQKNPKPMDKSESHQQKVHPCYKEVDSDITKHPQQNNPKQTEQTKLDYKNSEPDEAIHNLEKKTHSSITFDEANNINNILDKNNPKNQKHYFNISDEELEQSIPDLMRHYLTDNKKFIDNYKKYFLDPDIKERLLFFVHKKKLFLNIYKTINTDDFATTFLQRFPLYEFYYEPRNIEEQLKFIDSQKQNWHNELKRCCTTIIDNKEILTKKLYHELDGSAKRQTIRYTDPNEPLPKNHFFLLCIYIINKDIDSMYNDYYGNNFLFLTIRIHINQLITLYSEYSKNPTYDTVTRIIASQIIMWSCIEDFTGIQCLMLLENLLSKTAQEDESSNVTHFKCLFNATWQTHLNRFAMTYKITDETIIQALNQEVNSIKETRSCDWINNEKLATFINRALGHNCINQILSFNPTDDKIDIYFFFKFIADHAGTVDHEAIYNTVFLPKEYPLTKTLLNYIARISADLKEIVAEKIEFDLASSDCPITKETWLKIISFINKRITARYLLTRPPDKDDIQLQIVDSENIFKLIYQKDSVLCTKDPAPPLEEEIPNLSSICTNASLTTYFATLNSTNTSPKDLSFFKKILIYINYKTLNNTRLSNVHESEYNAYSNQYTLKKYFYFAAKERYEHLNNKEQILNNHFQDIVTNKNYIQSSINRIFIQQFLEKILSNKTTYTANKQIVTLIEQLQHNLYTINDLSALLNKKERFYDHQSSNMKNFYVACFNEFTGYQITLDTEFSIPDTNFKDYTDALQRYSVNSLEVFLKDPLTKELEEKLDIHIKEIKSRLTETIQKPFFLMDLLKNYKLLNDKKECLYIAWAESKGHEEIISKWKQENKPIQDAPHYIIDMLKKSVINDLDAAKEQLRLYGNPALTSMYSSLKNNIIKASDLHTLIPYIQKAQLCVEAIEMLELSRSDHNQ